MNSPAVHLDPLKPNSSRSTPWGSLWHQSTRVRSPHAYHGRTKRFRMFVSSRTTIVNRAQRARRRRVRLSTRNASFRPPEFLYILMRGLSRRSSAMRSQFRFRAAAHYADACLPTQRHLRLNLLAVQRARARTRFSAAFQILIDF